MLLNSNFYCINFAPMQFIVKYKLTLIGVLLGAIAGYMYYSYIGCASGTCAITSKPLNSTLYGALMGGLLLNSFKKDK
jgi:phage shock protein E